METRAVYAGSFDLLTVGHMWMIERGMELFDNLIVAVGINPAKSASQMFDEDERMEMIDSCLTAYQRRRCEITSFGGYLATFASEENCDYILRGVRNSEDFEYERVMRNLNSDFAPDITTVFLTPPRELSEVSSSIVKGLIGPTGWEKVIKEMVPRPVFEKLTNQWLISR